jgi:hypothetical protein
LAVLSACNSARYDPRIVASGIQGLSAAFAIAGVPSVVASLWPIDSAIARDLIVEFFKVARSSQNPPIADALAKAVRKHLEGSIPRPLLHPRFWASLVVVGDGAVELGRDRISPERMLGAYAEIDPADKAELLSADTMESDLIVGATGAWNGEKYASLVQRRSPSGEKRWEVKDYRTSGWKISAMGGAVFVGGYLFTEDNGIGKARPALRKITSDGKVLWERNPGAGNADGLVVDIKTAPDNTLLALVGRFGNNLVESNPITLLKLNADGIPVSSTDKLLVGDEKQARYDWGYVGIAKGTAVVGLNRSRTLSTDKDAVRVNPLGLLEFCFKGDEAILVLLDIANLSVRGRARIKGFKLAHAAQVGDAWMLAGDLRTGCGLETKAALFLLSKDGSTALFWLDRTPFATTAIGVRVANSSVEVFGTSKRAVAVKDQTITQKNYDKGDYEKLFGGARLGDEAQVSREMFAMRLAPDGTELKREFLGAGLPLEPSGIVDNENRLIVYGAVGLRPMWMRPQSGSR